MTKISRREFVQTLGVASALPAALRAQRGNIPAATPSLETSMASLRDAISVAAADSNRPIYHFRPPGNWTNDPNGTIYYRGWHHLFYQLNPSAPRAGNQHWGHARSRDLVNWEHLPIALWPLADRGERAIFSGGAALAADGKPRLIYTSIGHPSPEQWIAVPKDEDLISWDRPTVNPVLTVAAHGTTNVAQWRDPFMFVEDGRTYMVCGGNTNNSRGGEGAVMLYRAGAPDLTRWDFVGVVFRYGDRQIWNIECPNLFKLGTKWVLLMSPQQPCEYFVGDLDIARCRFTPETHGILDPGSSYASNISVDNTGRTILWLWGRTNNPPEKGWNGVMTLPRILSIGADRFLKQQPPSEFEQLRGAPESVAPFELEAGKPLMLDRLRGDCLDLRAEVIMNSANEFGIELRRSANGTAGLSVRINRASGSLMVGNVHALLPRGAERYTVRVFLDKAVAEVFINDGDAAVYTIVDAPPADLGMAFISPENGGRGGRGGPAPGRGGATAGNARIEALTVWPMKSATFSLEHFKG